LVVEACRPGIKGRKIGIEGQEEGKELEVKRV
jgi:hypothetical protein